MEGQFSGEKEEITRMIRAHKDRIKQQKDFADLYTKDGVLLPPGESPAVGTDNISKVIKKYYDADKMADFDFYEPEIEVLNDGKSAHSWHRFNLYDSEGKVSMRGKSVMVWKKDEQRKEWLLVLEMFNEGH